MFWNLKKGIRILRIRNKYVYNNNNNYYNNNNDNNNM